MTTTLQQRIDRALSLRSQGYNCAQCVAMVFDDMTDMNADELARASAALGGGIGGTRSVCGAVTGMAVATGSLSFRSPADKPAVYALIAEPLRAFESSNGSTICRELRSGHGKPCPELIAEAITLLHNQLEQRSTDTI